MIEVTRINGSKVLINPDLIEIVEETPDTVVAFTTGRKLIIKEGRQEIKNLGNFCGLTQKKVKSCGFSVNSWISALFRYAGLWLHQCGGNC